MCALHWRWRSGKTGSFSQRTLAWLQGGCLGGRTSGPFIVRWPGVVEADSVCNQLVHQADLLATFAEILSEQVPADAGEDSFSLLPLLHGRDMSVRETSVSCSIRGIPSIRKGDWKYIPAPGSAGWGKGGDQSQPHQLYNLANDLEEANNLASDQPERVVQLQTLLETLITNGRSTPGENQNNDVKVRRHVPKKVPSNG